VNEYEIEPVRGLPERLPRGEHIVWQGEPCWTTLARHAFHVRKAALYFALLLAWHALSAVAGGEPLLAALGATAGLAPLAVFALAVLVLLAWLVARTTVYTVTNRRVVLRFGVALPMTVNLPFSSIAAAALRTHHDGRCDIPLALSASTRIAFLVLWPHVRPWRVARTEPMLRAVPREAAESLAAALAAAPLEASNARSRASPRRAATSRAHPSAA